jgi:nitrogen fixation NifU-like protein
MEAEVHVSSHPKGVKMMYSEKVLDHFRNPRNVGEIEDADGEGTVGNPVCGDLMTIYIRVNNDKISDIKFKTFGCGAAIATTSMTTELAKGKTLDEAMKITREQVAEELGGLPPVKMHCSNLAADALHEAIKDYREKKGEKIYEESGSSMSILRNKPGKRGLHLCHGEKGSR